MRVALFASTFTVALALAAPASAQCVYVACAQEQTHVVQSQTQQRVDTSTIHTSRTFEEGYTAGLAARSHSHARPKAKTKRTTHARTARHGVTGSHRSTHRVSSQIVRPTTKHISRPQRSHAPRSTGYTQRHHVVHTRSFADPIKDRATTYRASRVGSSTTLASHMSHSSSFTSSTTWVGPIVTSNQGGQICGWGTRISTTQNGPASRQAMWVCQCPQGWRPPGY